MSGWEACFRRPQTYCKGYLKRNPELLPVSGVNIVGTKDQMLEELNIASKTFNTVRFWCTRFAHSFMRGEDAFTPIASKIPEGLKLIPILFTKGMMEMPFEKVEKWVEYWLQDEFRQHYLYIDVFNEPRYIPKDGISGLINVIERCRSIAPEIPICIGFGVVAGKELFNTLMPYCDVTTFHFYAPFPFPKYVDKIRSTLEYTKTFYKPIVITEFNVDTANEKEQTCWLANVLNEMKKADIEGYCAFCLREPPKTGKQWGIYRDDWSPKPSLELFP